MSLPGFHEIKSSLAARHSRFFDDVVVTRENTLEILLVIEVE
jgi:hypothetical protein